MSLTVNSRAEAKAKGLKRYFTGKPCKHGHIAQRHTNNGDCYVCSASKHQRSYNKENARHYYERNKEKIAAKAKRYREQNKEKMAERWRRWREKNPEKYAEELRAARKRYRKMRDKAILWELERGL